MTLLIRTQTNTWRRTVNLMTKLKESIRTVPDFPIPGVQFRDITGLLEDPTAFGHTLLQCYYEAHKFDADCVVAVESRGFIFGAPISEQLNIPFIPARKPGKLPNETVSKSYDLEYGSTEIHLQTISPISGKVVIVDDLIATGGTALACADLVHTNFNIPKDDIMILAIIDLPGLGGSTKIVDSGYNCVSLLEYDDE